MFQPAVCARELCVFAFQTLGVMSDAAEDIATGAEVSGSTLSTLPLHDQSSLSDVTDALDCFTSQKHY